MKLLPAVLFLLLGTAAVAPAQEWLDRLDEAASLSAFQGEARLHLSGQLDLEGYYFPGQPPGLIEAEGHTLFNPRLLLFADAQIGSHIYLFAQARVDRGFDPSDGGSRGRLDEYAIRITPWEDGRFNLQIGQFATVAGSWVGRHLAWDNPFINAPLAYEQITANEDFEPPGSAREFALGIQDEKSEYLPILWGPVYATGISVAGRLGKFEYAAEVKNASLSSRPESWSLGEVNFDHPTITTRVGYRPDPAWNFGVTASRGAYFRPEVRGELPPHRGLEDYQQLVLGHDVSFAWHRWQLWAEIFAARFEVPSVGNADVLSYYLEAKYKFTPQLYGALRWNQQLYASVRGGDGGRTPWGDDVWRVDAALGYRFTEHTQLKLQYSPQAPTEGGGGIDHNLMVQFTIRF